MKLLESIDVDKVLFETDFPHPTALYPSLQAHLAEVLVLASYDHDLKRRMLERNAVELYKRPL